MCRETTIHEKPEQPPKTQQIKSFIKNIGLPSSPITSKKVIAPPVAGSVGSGTNNAGQITKRTSTTQPISTTRDDLQTAGRKISKDTLAAKPKKSAAPLQSGGAAAGGQQVAPSSARVEYSGKANSGETGGRKEEVKSPTGTKSKEKVSQFNKKARWLSSGHCSAS